MAPGKLQQAIARYGEENFTVEAMCVYDSYDEAAQAEMDVIAGLDLFENGLNGSLGGEKGRHFIRNPHTEETKRKMRGSMAARRTDPAWIEKMREAARKRSENPEYRKKLSASQLGKKLTQEAKDKIAAANTGKRFFHSQETKNKIFVARKGKKLPPASYARMAATQKKRMSDPEVRLRISRSLTGRKQEPRSKEHCIKISEHKRKYWAKWREERAAVRCD